MSAKKSKEITVELLYFDGCPSYKQAWNDILDVLVEEKIDASVCLISVESMDRARELHFAGSPTIKVNGQDLEDYQGDGVIACRRYEENNGKGWPSKNILRDRVKKAM